MTLELSNFGDIDVLWGAHLRLWTPATHGGIPTPVAPVPQIQSPSNNNAKHDHK